MSLFHDEEDDPKAETEPVPGLPTNLPPGEEILWQGKPAAIPFAVDVFRLRWIGLYVAALTLWRIRPGNAIADGAMVENLLTSLTVGAIGMAILFGLGLLMARSTLYTLTNQRLVFRFGVGIRKYINLPFARIVSAGIKQQGRSRGSIALTTDQAAPLPFHHLWPHVRPFRFMRPTPLLRMLDNPHTVANKISDAMIAADPSRLEVAKNKKSEPSASPAPTSGGIIKGLATSS